MYMYAIDNTFYAILFLQPVAMVSYSMNVGSQSSLQATFLARSTRIIQRVYGSFGHRQGRSVFLVKSNIL